WDRVGTGSCRGRHAVQGWIDESARLVFDHAVAEIVLDGVNQLDIANRVRVLLDLAGNARVTRATQSHRPVDGGALTDFLLPVLAGRAQIVGEAKRGTRSVRTMNHHDVLV